MRVRVSIHTWTRIWRFNTCRWPDDQTEVQTWTGGIWGSPGPGPGQSGEDLLVSRLRTPLLQIIRTRRWCPALNPLTDDPTAVQEETSVNWLLFCNTDERHKASKLILHLVWVLYVPSADQSNPQSTALRSATAQERCNTNIYSKWRYRSYNKTYNNII